MLSMPASMDKSGPSMLERILRQVHANLICRSSSIRIRFISAKVATLPFLFSRHPGYSERRTVKPVLESFEQGRASADASGAKCPRCSATAGVCCG